MQQHAEPLHDEITAPYLSFEAVVLYRSSRPISLLFYALLFPASWTPSLRTSSILDQRALCASSIFPDASPRYISCFNEVPVHLPGSHLYVWAY